MTDTLTKIVADLACQVYELSTIYDGNTDITWRIRTRALALLAFDTAARENQAAAPLAFDKGVAPTAQRQPIPNGTTMRQPIPNGARITLHSYDGHWEWVHDRNPGGVSRWYVRQVDTHFRSVSASVEHLLTELYYARRGE